MPRKAAMSEVRFKVRRYALMLEEFTRAQIVEATGLNPESVRVQLRRMIKEGLLHSEPMQDKPPGQRGRPHIYRLTSDPEKRLALSRSIHAFYAPPSASANPTPTSPHYHIAKELFKDIESGNLEPPERREKLIQAQYHLEFASEEELGIGEETEITLGYLDYEYGRWAYLCREFNQAEEHLKSARHIMNTSGLDTMVAEIDAYLVSVEIKRSWNLSDANTTETKIELTLEKLQEFTSIQMNPILRIMTSLLYETSRTPDVYIMEALEDQMSQMKKTLNEEVRGITGEILNNLAEFQTPTRETLFGYGFKQIREPATGQVQGRRLQPSALSLSRTGENDEKIGASVSFSSEEFTH